MAVKTIRDWRGIKHQLGNCSTPELLNLRVNAEHTSGEVARFIRSIDAELAARNASTELAVA
jgi:hypothetical protein